MNFLAKKITLFYFKRKKINLRDIDKYIYCFEMLLSNICNIIILIISSIITKNYYQTLIFSIIFIVIRRAIGGLHANTHIGCISILILMIIGLNFILKINYTILNTISIGLSIICLILISIFAPIGHPYNKIKKEKLEKLNTIAVIICTIYSLIILLSYLYFPSYNIGIIIAYPLLCSTIFMILGYFKYKNYTIGGVSYEKENR